jgi:hypothetical protein
MKQMPPIQLGHGGSQPFSAPSPPVIPTQGCLAAGGYASATPSTPDRRSGVTEGFTAQTAISAQDFRPQGNLLYTQQGGRYIIFDGPLNNGSIPTDDDPVPEKRVAMTAEICREDSVESDHDCHELATAAFVDLPMWILQLFAKSQPSPSCSSRHCSISRRHLLCSQSE